ncbi:MAG: methylenetetrahydrofolate reductase [Pseudomonadota bacterium]
MFSRTHAVTGDDLKVSFEFFPAKNPQMEETLAQTIDKLAPLNPDFVSVTYGAGGSTKEPSKRTLQRALQYGGMQAAAHITCVGTTKC